MALDRRPNLIDRATDALRALLGREPERVGPELGWGGAKITAGIVNDEHVSDLMGVRGIQAATKMRRTDAQVRAVEKVIALPLRSTTWLIEEPDGAGSAEKEAAELLRQNLMGGMEHSWDDLIREAALAIYYGFRVPEIVWEDRGGLLAVRKIAGRNPDLVERWLYDESGRLAGYLYSGNRPLGGGLQDQVGGVYRYERVSVPIEKTLHFAYDAENELPTGMGLWRSMYGPHYVKQALVKILAIGIERNLLDVPVGRLGQGAMPDERAKLMTILRRWRAAEDAAVVLTEGQNLEFVGSQRGLMDAMPFLSWLDFKITMSALCAFLNLGQGAVGTQALASEHVKIFLDAEEANARWIQETITSQLVKRWCLLNYGPKLRIPQVMHRRITARDIGTWTNALNSLVAGGLIHATVDDEQKLRDELELPAIPREQLETLEQQRQEAEAARREMESLRLQGAARVRAGDDGDGRRTAREPGPYGADACGHQFAEDEDGDRAERLRDEAAFAEKARELLESIQEGYLQALRPLVEEAQDATRIAQGKPIDKLPDVAVPGARRYTEFVRAWLWEVLEQGRAALAAETGREPKGTVSNRLRQWITARAELIAHDHLAQMKTAVLSRILAGLRAELPAEQIFSAAGAAAAEEFGRHVETGWHAAAAELLQQMAAE